jgi:hypothetical protein
VNAAEFLSRAEVPVVERVWVLHFNSPTRASVVRPLISRPFRKLPFNSLQEKVHMPLNITIQRASGASKLTLMLDPEFHPDGHLISVFDQNPKVTVLQPDIVLTWDPAYFSLGGNHLYGDEDARPAVQTESSATWRVTYMKGPDRTLLVNLQCRGAANGPSIVSVKYGDHAPKYGELEC